MGYEDSVYLAKLAEQAERYEGMRVALSITHKLIALSRNG
jgi:hypothetical protein